MRCWRGRSVVLVVGVLLLGCGAARSDAARRPCLRDVQIGTWTGADAPEVIAGASVRQDVYVDNRQDTVACPHVTATFRKPSGALVTIPVNEHVEETFTETPGGLRGVLAVSAADAGTWHVVSVQDGHSTTIRPNHTFRMLRAQVITLSAVSGPPGSPGSVRGTVRGYTAAGVLAPSSGRDVDATGEYDPSGATFHGVTDGAGRFTITGVTFAETDHRELVRSAAYGVYAAGYSKPTTIDRRQPTFLDGRAAVTDGSVVRPGVLMSTWGHTRIQYRTGRVGRLADQKALVQIRVNGGPDWDTVATVGPTSEETGYFIAHWHLDVPKRATVEVRTAYLSPFESVRSSWLYRGEFVARR